MMQARKEKRSAGTWIASAVAIALLPKCVACVAAYVAIGAGAAAVGSEWCGEDARDGLAGVIDGAVSSVWVFAWLGAAVAAWVVGWARRRRACVRLGGESR